MIKYISVVFLCFACLQVQAQWQQLNIGTTETLTSVDFINAQTGLVCGTNKIWKTSDGGQSWSVVFNGNASISLEGVRWASDQVAVAVGFNSATNNGYILRSTDGGQSWNPVTTSIISLLTDVFFVNEMTGFICGGNKAILKTTNGGSSWSVQSNSSDSDLYSIFFINENEGFAAGGITGVGRVLHTTNGGQNWADLAIASPNLLLSVFFPSPEVGYASGQGGELKKTVDGGENWTEVNTLNNHSNLGLYFLTPDWGYTVGGTISLATIQKTENGGTIWTSDAPPGGAALFSIDFAGGTGYAVGINGLALKTEVMVGTADRPELDAQVNIYPNPVSGIATVESSGQAIRGVKLYDEKGRLLRQEAGFFTKKTLDFSGLPSANYYLNVVLEGGEIVRKVVKTH